MMFIKVKLLLNSLYCYLCTENNTKSTKIKSYNKEPAKNNILKQNNYYSTEKNTKQREKLF